MSKYYKYGDYNMSALRDNYSSTDLELLWTSMDVQEARLRACAEQLERKDGSLYHWLIRLADDLKDLADASYDADHIDEFPEMCRR